MVDMTALTAQHSSGATAARVKGQGQNGRILLSDAHRVALHAESQSTVSPFDRR